MNGLTRYNLVHILLRNINLDLSTKSSSNIYNFFFIAKLFLKVTVS